MILKVALCQNPQSDLHLNFTDSTEKNYYMNICFFIDELNQGINNNSFEHISNFFLDSLDSYLIPYIFQKFKFLPISDPEYFIDLSPTTEIVLECLKQRNIYQHIIIQSEEYKEWSKEAFIATKDQFFATQNTLVFKDKEYIQYFLNETKSIDFIIDALSQEDNNQDQEFITNILLDINYSSVIEVKEEYLEQLTHLQYLIDILYILPIKYEYSFIKDVQQVNEKIKQLQINQILLLYSNALHFVPQENLDYWHNIELNLDQLLNNQYYTNTFLAFSIYFFVLFDVPNFLNF